MTHLDDLKAAGEAPQWMNEEGLKTLQGGYLQEGETPLKMYQRVAKAAGSYYGAEASKWESKFFEVMWRNWLGVASPILSNMGTSRGFPISCNSISPADSIESIFDKVSELAILSKNGAGVGIYLGDVRGRGAPIKGNGKSEGIIPWAKIFDATTHSVSQGSTRRGASAIYLPIEHLDIEEFLQIRRHTGDVNRRCHNINHGICINDEWMRSMLDGDQKKRELWMEILKARVETGEPYLFFSDTVNRANPKCYVDNGLGVKTSNICCLAADTRVTTSEGPRSISSLVGETPTIWDGSNWVENSSFSLRGEDKLLRIHLKDGSFVDCNPRHNWYVSRSYNQIRNRVVIKTPASSILPGEYIEFHDIESHGPEAEAGAYLKGFLLGDGTQINGSRPLLNLHSVKYGCEQALLSSCSEIEVTSSHTNTIETPEFGDEIVNPSQFGEQIFKSMRGLSARKKDLIDWVTSYRHLGLPERTQKWNRTTKLSFLSGFFDSDGTCDIRTGVLQCASIHKPLIDSIQYLLMSLGLHPSYDNSVKASRETLHRLTLPSSDVYKIKGDLTCQRLVFRDIKPNRRLTTFRKVVRVEELDGIHPVYCPTVPSTGKFALASGLMTGNSEITLHTDPEHTFVCCLSSLNLTTWEEWKDTDTVETTVRFLDAVLEEYIQKTEGVRGMEASRRSAIKGRAIGIGALGWHTLLQQRSIPFDSFDAMQLNAEIFRTIRTKAEEETARMAMEMGEPEWCKGHGRRHTHLMAIAPTVSNSTISGGHSAGIEPITANYYNQPSAKGTFIRKNPTLVSLLEEKGMNTLEVWSSINEKQGSVQHLKFLSDHEKEVFRTAREINQHALVKQAAQRQKWVDQAQSLNLFFASNSDPRYVHAVHIAAWEEGVKTLYYCRASGVIRGDLASRSKEECLACEG